MCPINIFFKINYFINNCYTIIRVCFASVTIPFPKNVNIRRFLSFFNISAESGNYFRPGIHMDTRKIKVQCSFRHVFQIIIKIKICGRQQRIIRFF